MRTSGVELRLLNDAESKQKVSLLFDQYRNSRKIEWRTSRNANKRMASGYATRHADFSAGSHYGADADKDWPSRRMKMPIRSSLGIADRR